LDGLNLIPNYLADPFYIEAAANRAHFSAVAAHAGFNNIPIN
jgi:hypothetical protein